MTHHSLSRRSFIQYAVAGTATVSLLGSCRQKRSHSQSQDLELPPLSPQAEGYNILFIFTDQERYFPQKPSGLTLPGHERLQQTGITFHNHYTSSTMCTASRSVLLTGLSTPVTGMFENTDVRYISNLSTDIPTYGHLLRQSGYYTAYKGKWHLSRDFESEHKPLDLTQAMAEYGFSDYYDPGDIIGHTLGGYLNDHLVAGSAIRWLRNRGRMLNDEKRPWCLTVSLVNPHDVMYFNTDAKGENRQDNGNLAMEAARAPDHQLYQKTWDLPLPSNLYQSFDELGRPQAHNEFHKMWGYILGTVPPEEEPWQRLNNYYINCIREVDQHINRILQELDHLDLSRQTIIIFSSDHGEMAGAHGLRGKGPFAYEESIHLPFYIVHPDVEGGQNCQALTSHIDLVPTLLSMAGVKVEEQADLAGRELPGKDLTTLLSQPEQVSVDAVRDSILFTYSGLMTNDSELVRFLSIVKDKDGGIRKAIKEGTRPNLKKRGSLRTVFDGQYKFTRYFSPTEHNQPSSIEDLYAANDVELFDLKDDPQEMNNLALNKSDNEDLILSMNQKLQQRIQSEIGKDDGSELPNVPGINWSLAKIDL
ncbi:sulfatase-like hydrolase/transferase [Coleofasciculus sp. F4-SAH-05]|uniref:sulfatase-like hydrolase/transferase n=1 Tax=Coleofasciculus sp. F4-SAH-05 TaxID=3069525 RepID=UPI0032FAB9AE